MIRLYTNENFPFPAVKALRELGYNILTTQEAGLAGQAMSDIDVFKYSISKKRILITLNRKHFIHLHEKFPDHYGIIVCTFDPDFNALANRIHHIISEKKDLSKILIRINRSMK
ncbi:MAG: DUF5615 family PIN-like protein [Promethearchaeota archaeon]